MNLEKIIDKIMDMDIQTYGIDTVTKEVTVFYTVNQDFKIFNLGFINEFDISIKKLTDAQLAYLIIVLNVRIIELKNRRKTTDERRRKKISRSNL